MKPSNKILLGLSVVLMVISIIFSSITQTRFGTIKMSRVSLETDAGTLSAYLFKPSNAKAGSNLPCVVLCHSDLESKESEDAYYVELARRGYVVLAMDAFGHGDSDVANPDYAYSDRVVSGGMIDMVFYAASLDCVDITQIGVCGLALGGFYANYTMRYFTTLERSAGDMGLTEAEAHEINLINTGVMIGYYPENILTDSPRSGYLCNIGIIIGQNDEFFYESGATLLTSDNSRNILRYQSDNFAPADIEDGTLYRNTNTGYGIVFFNPSGMSAQYTFSYKTVGYVIDIFTALMPSPRQVDSSSQIWIIKEILTLLGYIGFFLFIVPFTDLLLSTKYFSKLKDNTCAPLRTPKFFGGYLFRNILMVITSLILIVPLFVIGYIYLTNGFWPQEYTGGISLWLLSTGLILLLESALSVKQNASEKTLGLKSASGTLFRTVLLSLCVTLAAMLFLFIAKYVFKTDFSFWIFKANLPSWKKLFTSLRYLPLFFVYFLFQSLSLSKTNFISWSERKQLHLGTLWQIAAPLLFLLLTFLPAIDGNGTLWIKLIPASLSWAETGRTLMGFLSILMLSYLPLWFISSRISIKLHRLTGNIWLGAFLNSFLMTILVVSDSAFTMA